MANTLKPFNGVMIGITEDTTNGLYWVMVFKATPTAGTGAVNATPTTQLKFTDAQFPQYKAAVMHLLGFDLA